MEMYQNDPFNWLLLSSKIVFLPKVLRQEIDEANNDYFAQKNIFYAIVWKYFKAIFLEYC